MVRTKKRKLKGNNDMAMRTKEQDAQELDFFKKSDIKIGLHALGFTHTAAHTDAKTGKPQSASWKRGGTALKTFKSSSGDSMWTCTSGTPPHDRGGRSGTIVHIAAHDAGSFGLARVKLREIYGDINAASGSGTPPNPSPSPSPSSTQTSPSHSASGSASRGIERRRRRSTTIAWRARSARRSKRRR